MKTVDYESKTPLFYMNPENNDKCVNLCIDVMINGIAKQESFKNSSVSILDLDMIQKFQILLKRFQQCKEELFMMAGTKFYPPYW